ncbi:MAG: radical SAM protein [Candidatus Omnitrophica bacterium]|nr:radical SAM protein [Candidatus Omnitrophota bacterium]MBU1995797.1 radical SAM protein [Candidatus Omnitrophota bacterium]MBU4333528.1 radical SAM protein [Candidatus Omnitrophota bacterium]
MKNKAFEFGIKLLKRRLTRINSPFLVQFSVTNRCNAKCNYCYATYYERPDNDLPFIDVKRIIDDLSSAGTFRINFVGGEPLVRNDIHQIICYAKEKYINCALTTNGILVKQNIETLKLLDSLCFSVDGSENNNDLNRGDGSYKKAIEGLEICKNENIKVQLSAVLTKHTVNDVEHMVGLAKRFDCKVGFTTLISQNRENKIFDNDLQADIEQTKNALKQIISLKENNAPILFSVEAYKNSLLWPDYKKDIYFKEKPDFKYPKCYAGKYFFIIDYNGDIYPCPQLVGIFKPKNILKDGFKEAFDNASKHSCNACSMPCSNEFSMFFDLNPRVMLDQFINRK